MPLTFWRISTPVKYIGNDVRFGMQRAEELDNPVLSTRNFVWKFEVGQHDVMKGSSPRNVRINEM